MGIYTVNKCILLDEKDFAEMKAAPFATFEELSDLVRDKADSIIGFEEYDDILTEVVTVISERFGEVECFADIDPCYVKDSWNSSLNTIAKDFAGVEASAMAELIQTGDLDALKAAQIARLHTAIDQDQIWAAQTLLGGIENLKALGLPGFRSSGCQDIGGSDEAYDFRDQNHGAGTRLLVEYAILWP